MKTLILICIAAAMMVVGNPALAGDHRSHGRAFHAPHSGVRHLGHRPYARPYRSHKHHDYRGGSHKHHDYRGGYLLGGIVLGSLLAAPRYDAGRPDVVYVDRYTYRPPRVVYRSAPPVIYRDTVSSAPPPLGRSLLRDINGRCYERTIDHNGNELRTQVPATECDW